MKLHLMGHPQDLAIVRLDPDTTPDWDFRVGPFATITWTETEMSPLPSTLTGWFLRTAPLVTRSSTAVPPGLRTEGPFRAVEVAGPLEFGMYGVMAQILAPLVDARISVLAMSTFDTDWILVQSHELEAAAQAWRRGGLIYTATTLFGSTA